MILCVYMTNYIHPNKGSGSPNWKGDKITYKALHTWVRRNYGKAIICEDCGENTLRVDWANISRKYKRERSDWKMLCRKCHYKFDRGIKGNPNAKLTNEQIQLIRSIPKTYGSSLKLAKLFKVDRHTIYRYRCYKK